MNTKTVTNGTAFCEKVKGVSEYTMHELIDKNAHFVLLVSLRKNMPTVAHIRIINDCFFPVFELYSHRAKLQPIYLNLYCN